ncbi:carbamate kinase [Aquihabitans daechungensis]|uniref:carbamate kinase n=1 Tax=Aquihabitans daechungensis TaxID=1052257 RepID=UPI003BA1848D
MRIVVALGGNALLRRGDAMTVENQRANVAIACEHLAPLALEHELVISHGNGPQVGLLALEGAAYKEVPAYPLDVLGAESQGMIGYLLELDLADRLPPDHPIVAMLTMIEVDPADPAFDDPTKPIGPIYRADEVAAMAAERGWTFRADGEHQRRVVASPAPKHIFEQAQISLLLEAGCAVICAGGGGIPVARDAGGRMYGVEAVIDKDHASSLLARQLGADVFVMATDTDAAYIGWGTPEQRPIVRARPDTLLEEHGAEFAAGSMLPKVTAACDFARASGKRAVIGKLADIEALVAGTAGTNVTNQED